MDPNEFLRCIVDYTYDWESWHDPEGNVIWVNRAVERVTGYTPEEYIARANPGRLTVYEPDRPTVAEAIVEAARNRETREGFQFRIQRKDGVIRWVQASWQPAYNSAGAYAGIRSSLRDITLRKEVEQALAASEERYRRITDAITDYIYTVRVEDGRSARTIHAPTSVAVTGYTPEEFTANPYLWLEMIPLEDRGSVERQADAILHGREVEALEHRIIRKDGAVRWVRNTAVAEFDAAGRLISYDGIIRDITDRRLAEEEKDRLILKLEKALLQVKTLSGFIPICANCKKIRDDNGFWEQVETYVQEHSAAQFSHSICPDCRDKLYPEVSTKRTS